MKSLFKLHPKLMWLITAITVAMGFCFSLASAILNIPLSPIGWALWLLLGTAAVMLLGIGVASCFAVNIVEGGNRTGTTSSSDKDPFEHTGFNAATGLSCYGGSGFDSSGNVNGSGWP